MPSPGDALAAKLAELVGNYRIPPGSWRPGPVSAQEVWTDLLAWVAEQGAAGAGAPVPATCTCRYANAPEESVRWADPNCQHHGASASPMPATIGNRPADARTGAAPAPEPSEGVESVNRAHRRDDDPAHEESVTAYRYYCDCDGRGPGQHRPHASAPDAALRAAAGQALLLLDRVCADVALIAVEQGHDARQRRALKCQREYRAAMHGLRAALSPDATGGDG